jgi:hypothetical protein
MHLEGGYFCGIRLNLIACTGRRRLERTRRRKAGRVRASIPGWRESKRDGSCVRKEKKYNSAVKGCNSVRTSFVVVRRVVAVDRQSSECGQEQARCRRVAAVLPFFVGCLHFILSIMLLIKTLMPPTPIATALSDVISKTLCLKILLRGIGPMLP